MNETSDYEAYKTVMKEVREFVQNNLATLCSEVLFWQNNALLPEDALFRKAARMVQEVDGQYAYPIVEGMVTKAAMRFVKEHGEKNEQSVG